MLLLAPFGRSAAKTNKDFVSVCSIDISLYVWVERAMDWKIWQFKQNFVSQKQIKYQPIYIPFSNLMMFC